MSQLTPDQVNYLNVGLMLVSAGLAFWRPFEVFLFVYAVLGPAHYLTEISWLHDRRYFTTGRHDYVFLIVVSVVVTLCVFNIVPGAPPAAVTWLTLVAFAGALVFALVRSAWGRVVGIAGALLVSIPLADVPGSELVFRMFLPTLIHVSIFTGAFILIGALRGRSLSGLLSLLCFGGALRLPSTGFGGSTTPCRATSGPPTGTSRTTARSPMASWGSTISS
jgi:hypothetical protein